MKRNYASCMVGIALTTLAFTSCNHDLPENSEQIITEANAFSPEPWDVMRRITAFNEQKRAHIEGLKDAMADIELSEAVWLSEADVNFMKCDASFVADSAQEDTLQLVISTLTDDNGIRWIEGDEFIGKQLDLLAQFDAIASGKDFVMIDVELTEVGPDWVVFSAYGNERSNQPSHNLILTGCYDIDPVGHPGPLDDATEVMNHNIMWSSMWPSTTFFVSISNWYWMSPIEGYGIVGGYTTYIGSNEPEGPDLIFNGQAFEQICFPDYWNRYLQLRTWQASIGLPPGWAIVRQYYYETYAPICCTGMDYGSPWYPMGPWNHTWVYKKGIPQPGLLTPP